MAAGNLALRGTRRLFANEQRDDFTTRPGDANRLYGVVEAVHSEVLTGFIDKVLGPDVGYSFTNGFQSVRIDPIVHRGCQFPISAACGDGVGTSWSLDCDLLDILEQDTQHFAPDRNS